jgi:hypothetical protein
MRNGPPMRTHVPQNVEHATETADGQIPHLRFRELDCPVMLRVIEPKAGKGRVLDTNWCGMPRPMRSPAGYWYALPGGYRVEGPAR